MRRRLLSALLVGVAASTAGLVPAGALDGRPDHPRLKLECAEVRTLDRPAVACDWSSLDGAAAYRLLRGHQDQRRTVAYRGTAIRHADTEVAFGHRYRYVVQALDERGRVRASSRPAKVAVAPEALKLECASGDGPVVKCQWSRSSAGDLARYRLWRGGDGHRRVVYHGRELGFVDERVRPGGRYLYKAQAFGDARRVVGMSQVVAVGVPRPEPDPVPVDPRSPVDPKPVPEPVPLPCPAATDGVVVDRPCNKPRPCPPPTDRASTDVVVADRPCDKPKPRPCPTGSGSSDGVAVDRPCDKPRPCPPPSDHGSTDRAVVDRPCDKPEPRPCPDGGTHDGAAVYRPCPEPKPQPCPAGSDAMTWACPGPGPGPEPKPRPEPKPEPSSHPAAMKLACEVVHPTRSDAGEADPLWQGPAVACRWSEVKGAVAYRLYRAERDHDGRAVVAEGADTGAVDHKVEPGHGYAYVVVAYDDSEAVIARSDVIHVKVP